MACNPPPHPVPVHDSDFRLTAPRTPGERRRGPARARCVGDALAPAAGA